MRTHQQSSTAQAKLRQAVIQARLLQAGMHLDGNETAILDRELRAVEAKVLLIEYPELKHRRFIPVEGGVDPGAESVWFRELDYRGEAKIIANYADDLPRVDISRNEFPVPVKSIGDSFAYSDLDLMRAAMSGVPLDAMRARAARDIMERKLDNLACFGDASAGLAGFINNANVTITAPLTANGKTLWSQKTPDDIIADLSYLRQKIVTDTLELHSPNTFLLPTTLMEYISTRRMGDGSDTTILKFFQANNPGVLIESWTRLKTANAAGTAGRIIAYQRDPMVLSHKIPLEYTQLPPERKNLAWIVNAWARTAGLQLYRPKAVLFMDGAE